METDWTVYRALKKAGLLTDVLKLNRTTITSCGPIPTDVQKVLTATQCAEIARTRYDICKEFQKELEDFYAKHFYKPRKASESLKEIETANISVSHSCNRTLYRVDNYLKGDNPRKALAWVSDLPYEFLEIYKLYTGQTAIDIRAYFSDLFLAEDQGTERSCRN